MIAEITTQTPQPSMTFSVEGILLIAAMNINDVLLLEHIQNVFNSEVVSSAINECGTPLPDEYDGTANAPGTVLIWHIGDERTYRIGFLNVFGEMASYFSIKDHRSGSLKSLFPVTKYEIAVVLKRIAHDLKKFNKENKERN